MDGWEDGRRLFGSEPLSSICVYTLYIRGSVMLVVCCSCVYVGVLCYAMPCYIAMLKRSRSLQLFLSPSLHLSLSTDPFHRPICLAFCTPSTHLALQPPTPQTPLPPSPLSPPQSCPASPCRCRAGCCIGAGGRCGRFGCGWGWCP